MKISKKFLHALIIFTMMSFFMFGCRNAESDTDTSTETETIATEAPETATEIENPQKEEVEESEVVPEEEVAEEPEVEEEPVVEEPAEEPLANEIIMNSDPIADWVSTLEEEDVKFIIYNDVEGYKEILNDGDTYHMKKDDKIFFYHPLAVIVKTRSLNVDVPTKPGDVNVARGNSLEIVWKDTDVVTFGLELTMEEYPEPKSVTCTFYKATE